MNDTREVRVAGFRWHLSEALAGPPGEGLFGPGGLRLEEWLAAGQAEVVKQTPHRAVYRVVLPGLDFHVKHYKGDRRDRLRRLLRGSRAAREYAVGREVAARGVPAPEVLAWGESASRLGPSDSFLLTRTVPDAVPLVDFLESRLPALPRPLRAVLLQRLARALGEFLARKHRSGVRHDDLHPGNLLVRFPGGEPELALIDLHAARLGRPLGWPASRGNLLMLDRWFAIRWSRADRRRAWRAYCRARPELALDERATARALARATQLSLVRHQARLDDRCLGGNRHYLSLKAPGLRGHAVADLDPAGLARLLADPDAPFDGPAARALKRSASSAVVEMELAVAGRPRAVIGKRLAAGGWRGLLALFRRPPALRSYVAGHALRMRGLPTPRPLAVWHRRRLGLPAEGYLLVEKVPEAVHLRAFVEGLVGRPARERNPRLWAVAEELGRLLRALHGWRLSHRDLKAANVLVSPAGWAVSARGLRELEPCPEAGKDRVWFIDLVGLRKHGRLGRGRRVRDLARLHVSFLGHPALTRADRLRFLRAYLAWGLCGKAGWKGWWRDVDAAARAKAARNARLGRVVG
jgi:tRNA A-37 threonylcarbamoyl transferase component Bud32